jgi:undecaprenyl-diphosphatase
MCEFIFLQQFLFLLLTHFFKVLQQVDINVLHFINHNRITFFDPFFIFITDVATLLTYSSAILLLLAAYAKRNFLLKRKSWLLLIGLTLNSAVVDIVKSVVRRPRPFTTYPFIHNLVAVHTSSFPSGHTAEVFMLAISVSILFPKRIVALIFSWLWAVTIAYSRMDLGVHYPSDILGSIVISGIIAFTFINLMIKLGFLQRAHEVELQQANK